VAAALLAMPAAAESATRSDKDVCGKEFQAALSAVHDARLPDGRHPIWLARGVTRAMSSSAFIGQTTRCGSSIRRCNSGLGRGAATSREIGRSTNAS
jgi:hypothetical protein